MSNLGWYQLLTTMAKRVGGPKNLIAILIGGGAVIGAGTYAGASAIKSKASSELEKKRRAKSIAKIYTISEAGKSNEGLQFEIGDTFKVLEVDGDAGLIERIGDHNNPYFVSCKFLTEISDFKIP